AARREVGRRAHEHAVGPRVGEEQGTRGRCGKREPRVTVPGRERGQEERRCEQVSKPDEARSQLSVRWLGGNDDESQIVHGRSARPATPKSTIAKRRTRVSEGRKAHLHCRRMTLTDFEAIPAVERAPRSPGLVVMKFGGTSVGDTERLKRVARRSLAGSDAGNRVVAVISAMGKTTDDLIRLAHEISDDPAPRELDMLASVGERISCALVAMAIIDLGRRATSLTGSQAGIV